MTPHVRALIETIIALSAAGEMEAASARLELLQRDHFAPFHPDERESELEIDRYALTLAYLATAGEDLKRNDAAAALASLHRALATWTHYPNSPSAD